MGSPGAEDDVDDVAGAVADGGGALDRDVSGFANAVGIGGVFSNLELSVSRGVRPAHFTVYKDLGIRDTVSVEVTNVKFQECVILVDRSALERLHLDDDVRRADDAEEERRDYLLVAGDCGAYAVLGEMEAGVFCEGESAMPGGEVWFTTSVQGSVVVS